MKEVKVLCTLYITCEDNETEQEAIDRMMMCIDPDVSVNIHSYEIEKID